MTKLIIILTFLIILFLFSSIHSSSNGIWTYPEDIRAGVFGADETLSGSDFYAFNNSVYFNREIITQNIAMNGVLVSGEVPWVRLSGHPSIIAGSGLVGGGVLNESRTINLESSYLDGSAHDLRFVNRGGDTMTGNLNMGGNLVRNVGNPINGGDAVTKQYMENQIATILADGFEQIVVSNSGSCNAQVSCPVGWTRSGCSGGRTSNRQNMLSEPHDSQPNTCVLRGTCSRTATFYIHCIRINA